MNVDNKKEILFYYQSIKANPNGDPGFEDQPRIMPDQRILVTDLRLKRTIREYAKKNFGKKGVLFVDYAKNDAPVTAMKKARELLGITNKQKKLPKGNEVIQKMLDKTFDVNLFGAFIPNNKDTRNTGEEAWYRLTGPVQFGLGKSVNKTEIIGGGLTISSHFVGKPPKKGEKEYATLGNIWAVDYALIKFQGGINPSNLGVFNQNNKTPKTFDDAENILLECIWDGTNDLQTKSKYPQNSVFYLEVTYKKKIYNDLPNLVDDSSMEGKIAFPASG